MLECYILYSQRLVFVLDASVQLSIHCFSDFDTAMLLTAMQISLAVCFVSLTG